MLDYGSDEEPCGLEVLQRIRIAKNENRDYFTRVKI